MGIHWLPSAIVLISFALEAARTALDAFGRRDVLRLAARTLLHITPAGAAPR